jgi:hypothetical protein
MKRVANKIGCFRGQINPHFISAQALSFCWGSCAWWGLLSFPYPGHEIILVLE